MRVRAVVMFSILRVLVFAVPFGILYALGFDWWVAALLAALLGFCLSYIFLRPWRERVALQLARARERKAPAETSSDEDAEDVPARD